jgi:hypothetical protein
MKGMVFSNKEKAGKGWKVAINMSLDTTIV